MSNLYPEGKKITVAGKEITIEKLPYKKFMHVSGLFTKIKLDAAEDFDAGADVIAEIISICTGQEKAWVESMANPVDVFTIMNEIKEVNQFPLVFKEAKAAMTEKKAEGSAPPQQ